MCDQRTRRGRVSVNDPTRIDMNACATLSLADAALVLGIHRSTASELYRRGEFPVPVLQIGHRCRVAKIHLERFLLAGTAEANASD
jgi:predicted DNA-binding transcriptional regulator AlpA